jgi:integrase
MAYIRKKRNKWAVRIKKKGYPVIYKSFFQKSDASKWAKQIESDMDRNIFEDYQNASNTTLKDILLKYRDEHTPKKKGALSEYYKLNKLINNKIALVSLLRLKSSHISTLKKELEGRAPQTIKHYIQLISVAWNTAKREWGITLPAENPCSLVSMPKINNRREYILTHKQYNDLINACSNYIKDFVVLLYETGARYSELAELQHSKVDLHNRKATFIDTKNGDDRTIPLNERALAILKRYRFGKTVFNIEYQKFYEHFCKARHKADLDYFHAHDLRACWCTNAILSGMSLPEVSALSGHKSWSMLRRYTRIKPEDLEEKVNKIVWIESK